jgi:FixJ family two-component response regulator
MLPLIHLVDDDRPFQAAVERLLAASGYRTRAYGSAEELLISDPDDDAESCILVDVQMPGLSGPELQERLSERGSRVPVIFLTGHGDIATSVRTIKAGAEDFLTKPVPQDVLLQAIDRAVARCRLARVQEDWRERQNLHLTSLTPREREVFDLVVQGKLNKQIAYALGTTERTIKAHRHKVMEKMEVRSLAELVSCAERLGLAGRAVA